MILSSVVIGSKDNDYIGGIVIGDNVYIAGAKILGNKYKKWR